MTTYLVRHAKAGVRSKWSGPDRLRPLSKTGRRQAAGLVRQIRDLSREQPITRIISSPYVRCIETVEPLAGKLKLDLELDDVLAEGARLTDALRLVEKHADANVVMCMHGDVLPELLNYYAKSGVVLPHDRVEKGSTWALDWSHGTVDEVRYYAPRS